MRCSRCDSEIASDARFCPACGAPSPQGAADPPPFAPGAALAPPPPGYGPGAAGGTDPGFRAPPPPPPPSRAGVSRAVVVGVLAVALVAIAGVLAARALRSGGGGGDAEFVLGDGAVSLAEGVGGEPETAWEAELDGSPVAVADDGDSIVVAAFDGDGGELQVTALGRGDGEERWSESFSAGGGLGLELGGVGLVVDEAVVVAFPTTEGQRLVGLDRGSGEELWEDELGDDFGTLLALDGVGLFVRVFAEDAELLRLDSATGETDRVVRGQAVVVAEGLAIEQDEEDIAARPVGGGDEAWQVDVGDPDAPGFAYLDGLVLVSDDDEVVASDLEGEEVWAEDASVGAIFQLDTFGTGQVLVGGEDGSALLDERGEVLWDLRDQVFPLARSGGRPLGAVYSEDEIEVVDLVDGETLGDVPASSLGDAPSGVELASGVLYLTDFDREVTAYALPEVEELWTVEPDGDPVGQVWAIDGGVLVATDEDRISLLE